ncbi:hypothetical protein FOPE_01431 [Fonsecaea pedrosoi]|nr:hypothetical protein FOPE_01431 [Fonsecaea pedrosoi]
MPCWRRETWISSWLGIGIGIVRGGCSDGRDGFGSSFFDSDFSSGSCFDFDFFSCFYSYSRWKTPLPTSPAAANTRPETRVARQIALGRFLAVAESEDEDEGEDQGAHARQTPRVGFGQLTITATATATESARAHKIADAGGSLRKMMGLEGGGDDDRDNGSSARDGSGASDVGRDGGRNREGDLDGDGDGDRGRRRPRVRTMISSSSRTCRRPWGKWTVVLV